MKIANETGVKQEELDFQKNISVPTRLAVFVMALLIAGVFASPRAFATEGLSGAPLTAKYRAVSLVGQGEDVWFSFEPQMVSTNVTQHLKASLQAGTISEAEAKQIFIELSDLTGARYELPKTRLDIMASLGFPEGTVMLATNWFEMAAVHLEMNLSLSAKASRFVLHAMGVRASGAVDQARVDESLNAAVAEVEAATTASVTIPSIESNPTSEPEPSLEPVVVEADRDTLSLEAALQSGNLMAEPALK